MFFSESCLSFKFIQQFLLTDVHVECLGNVAVTDLLAAFIFKYNVFPPVLPVDRPSPVCHSPDKAATVHGLRHALHDSDGAIRNKAFLRFIAEKVVFVLVPGADLAFLHRAAVKVFSLLRDRETKSFAQLIGEILLAFQVPPCLVELPAVNEGHGICDDVNVKVVFVLMDADQVLVFGEELIGKCPSYAHAHVGSNSLVPVKADDVVGVHPPGILVP